MHRNQARHALAGLQSYACPICTHRSTVGQALVATQQTRHLAIANIDTKLSTKLNKELQKVQELQASKSSGIEKLSTKERKKKLQSSLGKAEAIAGKVHMLVKKLEEEEASLPTEKAAEPDVQQVKPTKKAGSKKKGPAQPVAAGSGSEKVAQVRSDPVLSLDFKPVLEGAVAIGLEEAAKRLQAALAALQGKVNYQDTVQPEEQQKESSPKAAKKPEEPKVLVRRLGKPSTSESKLIRRLNSLRIRKVPGTPPNDTNRKGRRRLLAARQQNVTETQRRGKLISKEKDHSIETDATKQEADATKKEVNSEDTGIEYLKPLTGPVETISVNGLDLTPVPSEQPPVPSLAYGLDRVLFNPGVYQLQDPRSKVYNFDPYLQSIMPVKEFDFNSLKEYITSSKDTALSDIAKSVGKKYVGSTSSMTSALAHFHYLLSHWRPINAKRLSSAFPVENTNFTQLQRGPAAVFLKWQNGVYSIDADKEHATANVLSMLGKSMEKLLTLDTKEFERYRRTSTDKLSDEEKDAPEAYHYSTLGDFLMRSQLDAYDPRLPGTGMFDLKTRAVVSIRMNVMDYENLKGYEITDRFGNFESYEREYFDMIRAAFLKYSLQVRMGRMDGIFVAFHNTDRIFGFQYIPLSEMDYTIHGQKDTLLGDEEFKYSLDLLNRVLNTATERYPEQTIRLHFETRPTTVPFMYIFAEPVSDKKMQELQSRGQAEVDAFESEALGLTREPLEGESKDQRQGINPKADELVDEEVEQDLAETLSHDSGSLSVEESTQLADLENDAEQDDIDQDEAESEAIEEAEEEIGEDDVLQENVNDTDAELEKLDAELDQESVNEIENASTDVEEQAESTEEGSLATADGLDATSDGSVEETTSQDSDGDTSSQTLEDQILEDQSQDTASTFGGNSIKDALSESASTASTTSPSSAHTAKAPMITFTLTVRNKVGGKAVLRPQDYNRETGPEKPWTLDYSLTEIEDSDRAWKLYKMCKKRKRNVLGSKDPEERYKQPYVQALKEMSEKRTRIRMEQDKEEEGIEKVVYKEMKVSRDNPNEP